MPSPAAQLSLPRRVVALHLLFCLGAVLCTTGGMLYALQSLIESQTTDIALSGAERLAASLELDRLQTGGERTTCLLEQARAEGRLAHCAVIDPQGRYLAHTNSELVNEIAIEPLGAQLRWGQLNGVRFHDEQDRLISEYRTPIRFEDATLGSLLLVVIEPTWRGTLWRLAQYAPFIVLMPGLLIALGAWRLGALAVPLAEVERRLSDVAKTPRHQAPPLVETKATALACLGWNRLVQQLRENAITQTDDSFANRIKQLAAAGGGRSREALESLSEGVAVTDAEGRLDFANRSLGVMLTTPDLAIGDSLEQMFLERFPGKADELTGAGAEVEAIAELPLITEEGERTLRLSRAPLGGETSGGHVWCIRDITQQKLAEASRDQFIDTATHELRTPLANIKAYAETLAMGDMTDIEQQKEFCNTINTEATRLARFVDDLLSISSLEVGSLGINRQTVKVGRLLEETAEKVAPLMKQRSLKFEVALSEKLGEAKLDKDKVSGLLVNLLGNAAKYTPEGGTVTYTAVRDEDALKIEVRDTGVGIAEEEQAKVFDKFFRSGNPEVQDVVGTGLGLSLAREIAQLHRGDLILTSELGEGSVFTTTLPVS